MLDLKFRVYNKPMNIMCDYEKIGLQKDLMSICMAHGNGPMHYHLKDIFDLLLKDNIVLLYTGLKDKKGIEIYQGDIVVNHTDSPTPFPVEYSEIGCDYHGGIGFAMGSERPSKCDLEIIGNIYQHPHLLK